MSRTKKSEYQKTMELQQNCKHNWRFLETTKKRSSYPYDYDKKWFDIFYCTKCLLKKEIERNDK